MLTFASNAGCTFTLPGEPKAPGPPPDGAGSTREEVVRYLDNAEGFCTERQRRLERLARDAEDADRTKRVALLYCVAAGGGVTAIASGVGTWASLQSPFPNQGLAQAAALSAGVGAAAISVCAALALGATSENETARAARGAARQIDLLLARAVAVRQTGEAGERVGSERAVEQRLRFKDAVESLRSANKKQVAGIEAASHVADAQHVEIKAPAAFDALASQLWSDCTSAGSGLFDSASAVSAWPPPAPSNGEGSP